MNKIQLFGNPSKEILSIELVDILSFIPNAKNLYWRVDWLEAVSVKGFDMLAFETEARKGLKISYDELIDVNKNIIQFNELLLVASKEEDERCCDYIIELIDSSFWEVSSTDKNFIERIRIALVQ
ncbi:hypothetical protein HMPREF9713_01210 [Myroides odoratimimus CCUG 12700]|uniref:hypothetical protein n=1 Tax=Myroides odoratimimus TaxID=76832 RepID=UPI000353F387|nr:hypothetical protein [Myroides odoratimimus]EPH12369.1 hypothetical protein HMPREF9713_01210 [Myroides odoratimimus CCUG 12700]